MATAEFQDVVHYYPLDDMAGTAQFYLGEIAYQQKDYPDRDQRLQRGAGGVQRQRKGSRGAIAQGIGLMAMNKKRGRAFDELRSLIQRHPQTPEARAARSKLNGMGVRISPHE